MPIVPTADDLRTLNLAYRHMQRDFRLMMPEWFRDKSSLTTDASGYIYLPTYVAEIEEVRDSNNVEVTRIDVKQRFSSSGYYHYGMETTAGANHGKRRLAFREGGAAKGSGAVFTVHFLREYDDMASVSATPYPFTQKAFLDMLTTLQAYYWLAEQGEERKKEKDERWSEYNRQKELAETETLDENPEYLHSSHADSGNRDSYPVLNPSSS